VPHLGETIAGILPPRRAREPRLDLLPRLACAIEIPEMQPAEANVVERLGEVRRLGEGRHQARESRDRILPLLATEVDDRFVVGRVDGGRREGSEVLRLAEERNGLLEAVRVVEALAGAVDGLV